MIFDTHAHYNSEQFDADRDELLMALVDSVKIAASDAGILYQLLCVFEICDNFH